MKFFVLKSPKAGVGDAVTDFLDVDDSRVGEAPRCPVCGKFIGGLPLLPPVRAELKAWGSRWGDVAFGPGDEILISEKLKRLFTDAGLLGFVRFDPVEITKIKRRKSSLKQPPVYHLASIQRSQTKLDEQASGLVRDEAPVCEECRTGGITKRIRRVIVKESTWSGEDIFYARGLSGDILVSERFKRLCEDNDLANCSPIAAEDFGFDHYPDERPATILH